MISWLHRVYNNVFITLLLQAVWGLLDLSESLWFGEIGTEVVCPCFSGWAFLWSIFIHFPVKPRYGKGSAWQDCDALYFLVLTIYCSHSCIILGSFSGIMTTFQHNWNTTYLCIQFHPLRTRQCIELAAVQQHLKQAKPCAEASDTLKMVGSYEFVIWFVGRSDIFSFVMGSCCVHQLFPFCYV